MSHTEGVDFNKNSDRNSSLSGCYFSCIESGQNLDYPKGRKTERTKPERIVSGREIKNWVYLFLFTRLRTMQANDSAPS